MKPTPPDITPTPYTYPNKGENLNKKSFFDGCPDEALARKILKEKILSGVLKSPETGCWNWTRGKTGKGYGVVYVNIKQFTTHTAAYVLFVGTIPDGLQLDHLCRNRGCCNPEHLEPVTIRENLIRGDTVSGRNLRKTHCKNGHPFSVENTKIINSWRECRICRRIWQKMWKARYRKNKPSSK